MGCKCQGFAQREEEIFEEEPMKINHATQDHQHIIFSDIYRFGLTKDNNLTEFDNIEPDYVCKEEFYTNHKKHIKNHHSNSKMCSIKPSLKSQKTESTSPIKSKKSVRFTLVDQ